MLSKSDSLFDDHPDLKSLKRLIRRSTGEFSLFFAECNSRPLRLELAQGLSEQLEHPAIFIDLPTLGNEGLAFDEVIADQLKDKAPNSPIFVFGLEHWLPSSTEEEKSTIRHQTTQQINWRRSYFSRLGRPLVLWLPKYAIDLLADAAPDFYDWYSGFFRFEVANNPININSGFTRQVLSHEGLDEAVVALSAEETQRWLDSVEGLLADNPEDDSEKARLLTLAGDLYTKQGRYNMALPLQEQALELYQTNENTQKEVEAVNNLAGLHYVMGNDDQALFWYEDLRVKCRNLLDELDDFNNEHPDITINVPKICALFYVSIRKLAELYHSKGEYAQALHLYKASVSMLELMSGENTLALGNDLNELAELHQLMGDYEQALPLYQRSLVIYESLLGKEHPDVATSLNNLAGIYESTGEYEQALPLYQRSLAMRETLLGNSHPDVANSLNNLAFLYKSMGDYEQALLLYQRSLTMRETLLGSLHPDIANSLNNLAMLYQEMGEHEQALPLYKRALAMREALLGENHPDIAATLHNLAGHYYFMGEYEKAVSFEQKALAMFLKTLGKDHPHTKIAQENLAEIQEKLTPN